MSRLAIPYESTAQPQSDRPRNRLLKWTLRILVGLVIALAALGLSGASYQAIATAIDLRNYPAPGQMVDVGGYRLHIYCTGEGSPTVILDHVADANSAQWGLIQPIVARETRVCAYDRAGFGWSDASPLPGDGQQNVNELHTLLNNAGVPGPYVLVGHSFGAGVARLFAVDYPDDVAGLVLVDPGIVYDRPGVPEDVNEQWKHDGEFIVRAGPFLTRIGLLRLAIAFGALGYGNIPREQGEAFVALQLTTKFRDTLRRQTREAFPATSAQILAAEQQLGPLPLLVLSAEQPQGDRSRQAWTEVNEQIATLSPNGIHRVVPGSDHMSLALKQEHAQATVEAILQVIEAIRTGQPLAQ